MNFLNPIFLAGLATAVIPVLIYLWAKKNRKTLRFSSIFLFKKIEASAIRSLKIKEWLLVALRILALGFLVLGFAQPFLSSHEPKIIAQQFSHLLIDESPEFYFTEGHFQQEVLQSNINSLIETLLSSNPTLPILSTDSLNNHQFIPSKSKQLNLFHSVPSVYQKADSIQAKKMLVLTKNGSQLSEQLKRPFQFIFLNDERYLDNVGFVSVKLPNQIWQIGDANYVEVTLENYGENQTHFSLETWLDGQLYQIQSVSLEPGRSNISIPLQVYQRGWHELKLKINTADFLLDNEWFGGFYLPETINLKLQVNSVQSTLHFGAFASAAASVGLKVESNSQQRAIVVLQSSLPTNLTTLLETNLALIWLPDFSNQETIRQQMGQLGIDIKSIQTLPTKLQTITKNTFWNFIKNQTNDFISNNESIGLIDVDLKPNQTVLAYSVDKKPILVLAEFSGKPILLFLTDPFSKTHSVPIWSLTTLFHAVNYFNQSSVITDGFSSLSVKRSNNLPIPSVIGNILVNINNQQVEIKSVSSFNHYLSTSLIRSIGQVSISQQGEFILKSGINYSFTGSQSLTKPNSIRISENESFSSLAESQSFSLSTLFFALSLFCFLTESIISGFPIARKD